MPVEVSLTAGVEWEADDLVALAENMLAILDMSDSELSILLTDDAFIEPLNKQWRDVEGPTDVLSFPQGEALDEQVHLLGDVVISLERATEQAKQLGHDVATELRVLLAHGLAHLLGYDHDSPSDQQQMRHLERQLLGAGSAGLVERAGEEG